MGSCVDPLKHAAMRPEGQSDNAGHGAAGELGDSGDLVSTSALSPRLKPPLASYRADLTFPFVKLRLPSKVALLPSRALWVHEIKHDRYRLMVRRDGARVRCFTRLRTGKVQRGRTRRTASRPSQLTESCSRQR